MDQPSYQPEAPLEASPPRTMSLGGRMLNVIAAPGDAFDDVKQSRSAPANWLVPGLILIAISWVSAWLIFSQDTIRHQLSEISDRVIQKQAELTHMNEQQAEQFRAMEEKWGAIRAKIGAALVPLLAAFVRPFVWGLILWLVGAKVLKGNFPYMKAVEVVGLANVISILDVIVKTLLILGMNNLYACLSPVMFIKDFDPFNTLHSLLAIVNVMAFWLLAVRAVGLARLSGVSFAKAALWVYGIWAAYTGFFFGLGALVQAAVKRMGA
jgi:hypothetical protein